MKYKITSWNVNSLKVRLPQVLCWLEQQQPDVLALQETKLTDDNFPMAAFSERGYRAVFSGQSAYNGVALLSRTQLTGVLMDLPGLDDPQRRILAATLGSVRILTLYVVNGQEIESDKFAYKLQWLRQVTDFITTDLARYPSYIVMGDFNIAPDDRDVYDPETCQERILCSTPERRALSRLLGLGFEDTFRCFESLGGHYSWWDYRAAAFRRNRGLRIDLILASERLAHYCTGAGIDIEPRRWERPSDHAPVWATFEVDI